MDISKKLVETHSLSKEECLELFSLFDVPESMEYIKEEAVKIRKKYYGTKVFTRGLIEFTNYCKNNCYYCGIRRDNRNIERYRLTEKEILDCCANGEKLGFRTFVLQGGEDPWYTEERIADIVRKIKKAHPDCAITLSVGKSLKKHIRHGRKPEQIVTCFVMKRRMKNIIICCIRIVCIFLIEKNVYMN